MAQNVNDRVPRPRFAITQVSWDEPDPYSFPRCRSPSWSALSGAASTTVSPSTPSLSSTCRSWWGSTLSYPEVGLVAIHRSPVILSPRPRPTSSITACLYWDAK